jgi:hypothetical protein
MATFVFPLASQLQQLGLFAADFDSATVNLMLAPVTLGPNLTLADCVVSIATFTGYADQVYPSEPPVPYPDQVRGGVSITLPSVNFTVGADPTTLNDIYGLYITMAGSGGILILAVLFTNPYPMQAAADAMNIQVTINWFGTDDVTVTINGEPG